MVVDDDEGLLRLFASLVERLGCEVLEANGGAAALDLMVHTAPDLLILDLAMPGVSGMDVLYAVRAQPHLAAMKVMILTARPNIIPEVEALGIDCWLSKPVMPADFRATVRRVLEGTPC
jgi:DNA-binding response OmpR family regulator